MLQIFKDDRGLCSHEGDIMQRVRQYQECKKKLDDSEGGVAKFAKGYEEFGFQRDAAGNKWTFMEWLPNAKQVFLVGTFNDWKKDLPLKDCGYGRWSVDLPDKADGSWAIKHNGQYRISIQGEDGTWFDRVSAWAKKADQDPKTLFFNGVFYEPPDSERYVFKHPRPPKPENLKVYEAHVGMSSTEPKVANYLEFKTNVLPRIKRLGYNAVQFMAIAEHAYYGSFGYHVTSFFAPSSRSGTPDELKEMIDAAHGMGLTVLMDLVHAHASSNSKDGVATMDGTDHCYTHGGAKGKQLQWDSVLFDYTKYEVLRFLLSNCRWWLDEYGFDGFRFDGVTSMLYLSHGIEKGFSGGYHEYFGKDADIQAHVYLMLANDLIHELLPKSAVTVAEDVSGMPTLCRPVHEGGFGFDYRLAMAVPDMWIKLLKDCQDDHDWDIGYIAHTLQNRRWKEPCIAYVESHDQAIVGDKTTAFWLIDKEMYTHMAITSPPSMIVDRGLALHKMMRMVTLGIGGEGYLNFVGNEFGHPEWVDFPTELNGWTYDKCRRRFDLAEEESLKYKFFECFDEVMHACENRFKFVAAEHQYLSQQNSDNKVMVFERGDCLFVFNFHPTNSYTDYRVGHPWNEALRVLLDSDEGRFGGQSRLQWGHANNHQKGQAWDSRYHSTCLYLPSRTVQVLVRESLLKGGVTIRLAGNESWEHPIGKLLIAAIQDGKEAPSMPFQKDEKGMFSINFGFQCLNFKIFWEIDGKRKTLPFAPATFKTYFAGTYVLDSNGSLTCIGGKEASMPEVGDAKPVGGKMLSATAVSKAEEIKRPKSLPMLGPSEVCDDAASRMPENWPVLLTDTQVSPEASCDMSRFYSLSALDTLLNDPEEKLKLRQGMDANTSQSDAPQYQARHIGTPIIVVSSEVNPWSKTGGLGMVAGSYGYEFAVRGHRTMVISPMYDEYENCTYVGKTTIWLDGGNHEVCYFHQRQECGEGKGTDYIFVSHSSYPRPAGLYWDPAKGKEYDDNLFRFALLSVAALEAPLILSLNGSTYGSDVLFIANDWQTGLVPVYLLHKYRRHGTYSNARCAFIIHNMGYQGQYGLDKFPVDGHLGLPLEATEDLLEGKTCINLMSAAIKLADRVLTVSPNYAKEIQTPEGGQGLHDLLRGKGAHLRLDGILNGIADEWNPRTDPHIPMNYSLSNFEEGKAKCKVALQKRLGLHEDPNVALVGFCARLCSQKGVHLVSAIIPWLMHDQGNGVNGRVQIVLMGKGELSYANELTKHENAHKGRICSYIGFDPVIEHQMMAACDIYLMPSLYEPCGLPQMYAQSYGTLPLVHETGGLKDSVIGLGDNPRDRSTATGFLFAGFNENKLKERMYEALEIFHKSKDLFNQMQTNALKCNYYWPKAMDEYEKHVDWTLEAETSRR